MEPTSGGAVDVSTQVGSRPTRLARLIVWLGNLHRRMLAVYFAAAGPPVAYAVTGLLGRLLYRLMTPFRLRSEAQCRAALGARVGAATAAKIAERAFVQRVWCLTDLLLAERMLHRGTYARFGGRIPEPHLSNLLDTQQRRQPAILLSAYYGPFDLLPVLLGYNGVRAGIVYLPHANADFDRHRRRVRSRSGCEQIPAGEAVWRLPEILSAGGNVAIIADHHAEGRGLPVTFLGLPTMAIRSVGWLAWRFGADVVVAGIRRVGRSFRFEIDVVDVMKQPDWADCDDPVLYITRRYLRGLEKLVLRDPTQYLWGHARWGEDLARRLTAEAQTTFDEVVARRPSGKHAMP